jgi:hypothetical protein
MQVRLGEVLIERNVLTREQVDHVLEEQKRRGQPFGLICERLYGISPEEVEEAWSEQYARLTRKVDPRFESFDDRALNLVSRRQAWQFRVLPIRFDGDELIVATTRRHLRRALRFATKVIGVPVYLVIADPEPLGEAMCSHYPLAGMTSRSIDDEELDRLLALAAPSAA